MNTTFNQAPDHYRLLEIKQDATAQEIRHAYRKIILNIHPDRNRSPDAHDRTAAINEAYEILKDPWKRRLYDLQMMGQRRDHYRAHQTHERRRDHQPAGQSQSRPGPRREPESQPETRTDAATGITWNKAQSGNGWLAQTARCRTWVGYRKNSTLSCAVFLHHKYKQDDPTDQDAQLLTTLVNQTIGHMVDIDAAIIAISNIIDTASRSSNRATGTKCRICEHAFHDPKFSSCYTCSSRPTRETQEG